MIQRTNVYFTGFLKSEMHSNVGKLIMEPIIQELTLDEQYENTICTLAAKRSFFVTKPVPEFDYFVTKETVRRAMLEQEKAINMDVSVYNSRNKNTKALFNSLSECGVGVLDPTDYLCDGSICYSQENGNPLYTDGNHFTSRGSLFLAPMYKKIFTSF
jgi:hypothetical protein